MLAIWPVRSLVPISAWVELFERAVQHIDVLVFAGFWLSEDPAVRQVLVRKAKAGVRVRFLLGDPNNDAVQQRGRGRGDRRSHLCEDREHDPQLPSSDSDPEHRVPLS